MSGPGVSRRRFLKTAGAGLGAASITGLAAARGTSAARAAGTTASALDVADAVLAAFQNHRLVGLGETHGLQNHHDVLAILLNDPRIPEVVDDIVIEFANALYQPTIDRFIAGHTVDNAELRPIWRNTTQSPQETWDEPVYEQFFRTVRAVNWTLAPGQQMRVLAGDPPIDWSKITKRSEALVFQEQRDAHAASVVEQQVLEKGHRALVCYGAWHLLHLPAKPLMPSNLVNTIEQQTGERTYTTIDLVPAAGDPGGLARSLAPYARNAVIPTAGTWLGAFDTGFIPPVQGLKRGEPYNPWCGVPLGSLADAGLYTGQPDVLTGSWWNPAIFLDVVYWKELQRRDTITGASVDLHSYRQEQPARFKRPTIPRAAQCRKA